jgi:hypothetical protein
VQEIVIDYSTCNSQEVPFGNSTGEYGAIPTDKYQLNFEAPTQRGQWPTWQQSTENVTYLNGIPNSDPDARGGVQVETPVCSIRFYLPAPIQSPVLFYYRLTDFYQNHRRYVKSVDMKQLSGDPVPKNDIEGGDCDPLQIDDKDQNSTGLPYYPCGLIANSMFNDTFISPRLIRDSEKVSIGMTDKGIAWDSDKELYGKTKYNYDEIAVPPNWRKRWGGHRYTEENGPPDLKTYESFHVWMRTAGLPAFSKLAYRLDNGTMDKGMYQVDVHMSMFA